MLALLLSAALQRFCSNTEYQILIPIAEGLPWPGAHQPLARTPHLVPNLVGNIFPRLLLFLVNSSHLPSGSGSSLWGISHGPLHSCQPSWCPQTCGRCTSLLDGVPPALHSAGEIGMPEESAENAAGSQGAYWDILVLQGTHMLYFRVETCTVVWIWCQNPCSCRLG